MIGFSGGFRRSELVNIHYDDIEFVTEGVKILIKRSKTDQTGEGSVKAIPYFDNQEFCPVVTLKNYVSKKFSDSNDGKIFNISDKNTKNTGPNNENTETFLKIPKNIQNSESLKRFGQLSVLLNFGVGKFFRIR